MQYLGEEGENCMLNAAVVCSNPWNLETANLALQRTWLGSEVYSRIMGSNMKKLFEESGFSNLFLQYLIADRWKVTSKLYRRTQGLMSRRFGISNIYTSSIGKIYIWVEVSRLDLS